MLVRVYSKCQLVTFAGHEYPFFDITPMRVELSYCLRWFAANGGTY